MSELTVQTAFTAKDTTSSVLLKQAKAAESFASRARTAFQNLSKDSSLFKSVLGANLVSSAISRMTSEITRGVRTAVEEFIDFDAAIRAAADAGKVELEPGTKAFEEFSQAARNLASSTKYGAAEAANALEQFALSGLNATQAISALPYAAQLATATGIDLAAAATLSTDAMTAFGMMSDDVAAQETNLARINDILAKSNDTSKLATEEFVAAMKTSGPGFAAAGQSVETYMSLLGKMADAGMEGTDAGSKLTFMLKGLQVPSKAAKQATDKLNISLYDESGEMRDVIDFIADYSDATKGMSEQQRNAYTSTIFGKRGLDGVNTILKLGTEGLREYRDELKAAGGTARTEAKVIEESIGYKLESLKSSAIEVGFRLIESFGGEGKNAIDELSKALLDFDIKPIVEAAKMLVDGFRWLFRLVRDHTGTIKAIVALFVAWKVTMAGIAIAKFISGLRGIESAAGAAAEAVGGIKAPGGTPIAGAAGGGAAGGGAAGAAQGVVAAAGIGYSIGSFIEETWLDPIRKEGERVEVELDNLVYKMSLNTDWLDTMSIDEIQKTMRQAEITAKQTLKTPAISSLEGAASHINSGLMSVSAKVGKFFGLLSEEQATRMVEQNKGPIDVQREQMVQLVKLYAEYSAALVRARAEIDSAAKAATTEINVNVANAPAGTTVDAKGSKGAPKVNQGAAGKV